MAPAPDQLSAAGSASYSSDTMTVGDGTWDFTKNTFLLPNLQGTNFDTMRFNGMGNRFSTLHQYHTIILAHAIMMVMVFLFLVPASVMLARFYSREPGYAVRYHAQLHVFSGILLLAAFILPFFAVGPKRNLTNPHHGIGVAIFVLFILQLVGGRLVRKITKIRSFRIMLHQWSGRAIAILGITQVPLGLTLYGSPKYLFILYAVWMSFLVLVYFVLSYQSEGRREMYMGGGGMRSEAGQTRLTESEYFSDHKENHGSKWKWLGPLAAGAGIWALMRNRRNKNRDADRSRAGSRSPSMMTRSRGPTTVMSSHPSYFEEKYSDVTEQKKGGGFMKILGGTAAALGAAKLFSSFRRNRKDEEYSAVSTETPRRNRSGRATTLSEFDSEYTDDLSTVPPTRGPAVTETATAAGEARGPRRPVSPRPSGLRTATRPYDDSEYSSYVSPSRREPGEPSGGGFGKGLLSGFGMGWLTKRLADRRSKKDEERMRAEEEDMRSGTQFSRYTGDGYPSPSRRDSRRPPPRRNTGPAPTDITESSILTELPPKTPPNPRTAAAAVVPGDSSRTRREHVSMPAMPADPHGIFHSEMDSSDATSLPARSKRSRRHKDSDKAAAAAAARATNLAVSEEQRRFGSSTSQPVSVKLKVHDDRDRVTLRRLTDEEAIPARARADSETSLSALDSPTKNRRYRRDSSQRRAESAAETRVEQDTLGPLSPPNPAFAKGGRRNKDSGYYSGQPAQAGPAGPSTNLAPPTATVSSIGSHGTWSGMSMDPSGAEKDKDKGNESAADNRRRRRLERRRASSSRPSEADMFS